MRRLQSAVALVMVVSLGWFGCGDDGNGNGSSEVTDNGDNGSPTGPSPPGGGDIVGVWEVTSVENSSLSDMSITSWLIEFRSDGILVDQISFEYGGTAVVLASAGWYSVDDGRLSVSRREVSFNRSDDGSWSVELVESGESGDTSDDFAVGDEGPYSVDDGTLTMTAPDASGGSITATLTRSTQTVEVPQAALDLL